jgi:hypothetical protein
MSTLRYWNGSAWVAIPTQGPQGPAGPQGPPGTSGSGSGNVSNAGTPVAGQYAKWTGTTNIQGVSPATVLSDIGAQPLDADLTSLAGASATNAIYYRSAADTWATVTVGTGLSFSGGTLANTVSTAGLAPLASPVFTGDPQAPTPATSDNDQSVATTAFVKAAIAAGGSGGGVTIADTPPGSPTQGALWWESDTGGLYISYNDGNTTQWVGVPAAPPAPVGSRVWLATYNPAGTASVIIGPSVLTSAYDVYEIVAIAYNNTGGTTALGARFSIDGGATFINAAGAYAFTQMNSNSGGGVPANSGGISTYFQFDVGTDVRTDIPHRSTSRLYKASVAGPLTSWQGDAIGYTAAGGLWNVRSTALMQGSTAVVNGMQIFWGNGGNFGANSVIKVYGVS